MTKLLDGVAASWDELQKAITERLDGDAKKIKELTDELADLDAGDDRADEIKSEMDELLGRVRGVVAGTPAPATDSSQQGADGSVGQDTSGTLTGGTEGKVSA